MSRGPGEERVTKEVQAIGHKEVRTTVNNRNRKAVGQDSVCVDVHLGERTVGFLTILFNTILDS